MLTDEYIARSRQALMLGSNSTLLLESSKVLIVGADHIGFEIAKNILLAGVGAVLLKKSISGFRNAGFRSASYAMLEATDEDQQMTNILGVLNKLKGNSQTVGEHKSPIENDLANFTAVVFVNSPLGSSQTIHYNEMARKLGVKFIGCEVRGLIGSFFSDFGTHVYKPSVSEHVARTVISISCENPPIVTVADEDHGLYTDDTVEFSNVKGMPEINKIPLVVEILSRTQFKVLGIDASKYASGSGGLVQKKWSDEKVQSKSLKENLSLSFRTVLQKQVRLGFGLLWDFIEKFNRLPKPHSEEDADTLIQLSSSPIPEEQKDFLKMLSFQSAACLSPMATLFGGLVGQEVLKACLQTFKPVGFTLFSALDCLPENYLVEDEELFLPETPMRYDGQIWCFGKTIQEKLEKRKVFLVGAGALGCEFLKMFATMGVACSPSKEGVVYVTDPDEISLSNLHRQFLFAPSDVGKLKAEVASGRCVKEINSLFNVKLHTLEVNDQSLLVFHDKFWESLDEVVGAVDSVSAREYIDHKCHFYNIPFLESGTLGLKCSSNVHLPGLTPPYEAPPDPDAEIACSGKQFPFRPMHIIGWANNYFKEIWEDSLNVYKSYLSILGKEGESSNYKSWALENKVIEWEYLRGGSVEICKQWALSKLKTWLVDDPTECISKHPKDEVNSEGVLFWSGTKIFPTPVPINPEDPAQQQFVNACLVLLDKVFPPDRSVNPQHFEKDDSAHIEFIYTLNNLISQVYNIAPQTPSQVHQISGRIFAASLTTTAAIVGLVGLELYKVIQRENLLERSKFCQVDIGGNNILSRVAVEKLPLRIIPRWMTVDLHRDITVPELYKYILDKHHLKPTIIFFKTSDIQIALDPSDPTLVSEVVKKEFGRRFVTEYENVDRYWFWLEAESNSEYYNIKYRFR